MSNNNNPFGNLKSDFPASIVVFLVAVPLCLGIALASGAPLFSGIIAGIVGGIIVSTFSGSPLGVSGPAAGLAVIVLGAITELESFQIFLLAVVIAGVIQIILGLLKAGIIGYYFPSSVIKGMLSGIGIIIILKQIPHAFGYDSNPAGDFEFFQSDGHTTFSELYYMLEYISPGALIISTLSLLVMILWEKPFIKRFKASQVIQGPLVAVILGIILNLMFKGMPDMALHSDQVVSIPVAGTFSGFIDLFTFPDFSQLFNKDVYVVALTLAIVASLETLLCVEATDKLDPQKRITPTNRELIAQGIGNISSGLIGGLPITQVIVRSSANIQSGGKTKASAFIHGVLILFSAMLIPNVLNLIPLSSLAAILFVVGYKLAKPVTFKQIYRQGIAQFLPFMVTILGIVFTDLLVGIFLGLVTGVMYILWNNYRTPYHFDPEQYNAGDPITIELSEDVSFLNKAGIMNTLNHLPENSKVLIDASRAKNIHTDILEIFDDFRLSAKRKNIRFSVTGLNNRNKLDPVKSFKTVVDKHVRYDQIRRPVDEITN
ncbi:MAG: SulP family inorganic anion transporter [Cytophagales bacterium]|nr:SulP family inorganic anion transporter [Cytophagales bacterium]